MSPKLAVLTTAVALAASATYAQDPRVEIGVVAGWTFSDGVTTDSPVQGGDGVLYNSIEPDDAFSYSLNVGFFVNPNFEIGGLFSQQKSKMLIGGVAVRELGDWSVNNYHGYFAYNTGDFDSKARFYILGGLGATQYGGLSFTAVNGSTREIGGETLFSTTWGAGVKLYPGKNVGPQAGNALDSDLHQVGRRRLVVRPLLGLLRRGRCPVLEPVGVRGRVDLPLLGADP